MTGDHSVWIERASPFFNASLLWIIAIAMISGTTFTTAMSYERCSSAQSEILRVQGMGRMA
jgi:hypothetical protein